MIDRQTDGRRKDRMTEIPIRAGASLAPTPPSDDEVNLVDSDRVDSYVKLVEEIVKDTLKQRQKY